LMNTMEKKQQNGRIDGKNWWSRRIDGEQ
jgi:hypothetical protein